MEKSMDHVMAEKVSDHIPYDLEFSILSKLPLKSLKRFSCVRKSWSLLFQNPSFMTIYRNYFISSNLSSSYEEDGSCLLLQQTLPYFPNHRVLYLLSGETFENKVKLDWPPPFQEDGQSVFILGPVINGIVCLYQGCTPIVVLWNPTTNEFKVLPPSPTESPVLYEVEYFYLHGFGYDHVNDDYKVIRYATYRLDVPMEGFMEGELVRLSRRDTWEIYSLRSNSWRKLDMDMPQCYGTDVGAFVYMNEVCHWYNNDIHEPLLVSFDLHDEVFCITPMPSDMNDDFDFVFVLRYLMVLNQSIGMISNYVETTTFHISILGELGVKESWTKLFILGPLPCIEHPIGEGKNGDFFFRKKDDELVWFNLTTGMIEELGIKGGAYCCQILVYKANLLRLGGINE